MAFLTPVLGLVILIGTADLAQPVPGGRLRGPQFLREPVAK